MGSWNVPPLCLTLDPALPVALGWLLTLQPAQNEGSCISSRTAGFHATRPVRGHILLQPINRLQEAHALASTKTGILRFHFFSQGLQERSAGHAGCTSEPGARCSALLPPPLSLWSENQAQESASAPRPASQLGLLGWHGFELSRFIST